MRAVRLFNVVGPRQSANYGMVLPRFVQQAFEGAAVTVYGTGLQSRCFIHVRDVVEALLLMMDEEAVTRGRIYNVGSATPVTILDLAQRVLQFTGSSIDITFVPYERVYGQRFDDSATRRPDTSLIEQTSGWRPRRTLDDAIRDVIAEYWQRTPTAATAA